MPANLSSNSKRAILAAMVLTATVGCTTNSERSDLVAIKLVRPTAAAAAGSCELNPATTELVFGSVDPAVAPNYTLGLVVTNLLANNANTGIGRLNTNDFQVEQARISYELPVADPSFKPSIGEHVVPANGFIQTSTSGVVGVQIFPPDVIGVLKSAGSGTIRVKVRAEGRLLDGSGAKSSQYEYSVRVCATGPLCLNPPPCAGPKTLFFCALGQDADVSCQ